MTTSSRLTSRDGSIHTGDVLSRHRCPLQPIPLQGQRVHPADLNSHPFTLAAEPAPSSSASLLKSPSAPTTPPVQAQAARPSPRHSMHSVHSVLRHVSVLLLLACCGGVGLIGAPRAEPGRAAAQHIADRVAHAGHSSGGRDAAASVTGRSARHGKGGDSGAAGGEVGGPWESGANPVKLQGAREHVGAGPNQDEGEWPEVEHGCHACSCLPQCRSGRCNIVWPCTTTRCSGHCKWPNNSSQGRPIGACRLGNCSKLNPGRRRGYADALRGGGDP
eukprot:jgi/Ulvmu1/8650/UM046_0055.1